MFYCQAVMDHVNKSFVLKCPDVITKHGNIHPHFQISNKFLITKDLGQLSLKHGNVLSLECDRTRDTL